MSDQDQAIVPKAAERAARAPASSLTPIVDSTASAPPVDATAPQPDIRRTVAAAEAPRARSIEATILTVLALLYSLYFAREFLIPIVFALLLNFLLSPLIRRAASLADQAAGRRGARRAAADRRRRRGGSTARRTGAGMGRDGAAELRSRAEHKLRKIIRPVQQVTKNVEQAADAVGVVAERHVHRTWSCRPGPACRRACSARRNGSWPGCSRSSSSSTSCSPAATCFSRS